MGRTGRSTRAALAVVLLGAGLVLGPRSDAAPLPSVRLLATSDHQDYNRFEGPLVFVDPGAWIASTRGAFELRVKRRTYIDPVRIGQVDPDTHVVIRRVPSSLLDGWKGLANFLHVTVTDASNATMLDTSVTFCPASYSVNRVNDTGPSSPHYPQTCGTGPFTKGAVWGIDRGWSVDPFASGTTTFDGPDGHYNVTVSIEPVYRHLFAIPRNASSVTVDLNVTTSGPTTSQPHAAVSTPSEGASVPTITNPDPSTLPELASLPAWNFSTATDTATGDDLLQFAATEWNAGPQPMVVEGYRRPGTDTMDAYQYFYRAGRPIGRARVGTMNFESGPDENHWHFQQFALYSLLDANKHLVEPSTKEGFCLAPTDAIDMTLLGAAWRPYSVGLSTACGDETALWVREVLPAGWGDTYFQSSDGQSFDISAVPNGTYYVRIQVNPLHRLYERFTANDTQLRQVILGGTAGARTVSVPPWRGIDTECGCFGFSSRR